MPNLSTFRCALSEISCWSDGNSSASCFLEALDAPERHRANQMYTQFGIIIIIKFYRNQATNHPTGVSDEIVDLVVKFARFGFIVTFEKNLKNKNV